jgi:hypothetical protein
MKSPTVSYYDFDNLEHIDYTKSGHFMALHPHPKKTLANITPNIWTLDSGHYVFYIRGVPPPPLVMKSCNKTGLLQIPEMHELKSEFVRNKKPI